MDKFCTAIRNDIPASHIGRNNTVAAQEVPITITNVTLEETTLL
jgi:hypothetical protein